MSQSSGSLRGQKKEETAERKRVFTKRLLDVQQSLASASNASDSDTSNVPSQSSRESPNNASQVLSTLPVTANRLFQEAKDQMEQSGNLKTSIKEKVLENLGAMFEIILRLSESRQTLQNQLEKTKTQMAQQLATREQYHSKQIACLADEWQSADNKPEMQELLKEIKSVRQMISFDVIDLISKSTQQSHVQQAVALNKQLQETGQKLAGIVEEASARTYAEAAASRPATATANQIQRKPSYTIIVSSAEERDTSEDVLQRVRGAADARTSGLAVERIRKARDQKVVISCSSKDIIDKLKGQIKSKDKGLKIEDAQNKDPLVIVRNVLNDNTDDQILDSLRKQNNDLVGEIPAGDYRASIKYRRRTRNPQESHVVLQVSPRLWSVLTLSGKVHIDLQRCTVADQSPLVQCTKCLGYGHGRRYCKAVGDSCSHCGGGHLRANCPVWSIGEKPSCTNCQAAKMERLDHSAFDGDCPVRKRWDAIARSSVSYY